MQGDLVWIKEGLRGDIQTLLAVFTYLKNRWQRFTTSHLFRTYYWALIPLVVVGAVEFNAHLYYNTFWGYDMPLHFNNAYAIMTTGSMPAPPAEPQATWPYLPN